MSDTPKNVFEFRSCGGRITLAGMSETSEPDAKVVARLEVGDADAAIIRDVTSRMMLALLFDAEYKFKNDIIRNWLASTFMTAPLKEIGERLVVPLARVTKTEILRSRALPMQKV